MAIFLAYITLLGLAPGVGRTYRYHGAEHMTIHMLEAGEPLTVANARRHPTAHPRCGTEFLLIVMVLAIVVFGLLGRGDLWYTLATRLVALPVLAGVSYEILRYLARHRDSALFRSFAAPGIWLQAITTRQPDDSMIEVAIAALRTAMGAEGQIAPAGSLAPTTVSVEQVMTEGKASRPAGRADT